MALDNTTKGRYSVLATEEICKSTRKDEPSISTALVVTVKQYEDPMKSPNEYKKNIWLQKVKSRNDVQNERSDCRKVIGNSKLSVSSLKKLKLGLVTTTKQIKDICDAFQTTVSVNSIADEKQYKQNFVNFLGTSHGYIVGAAMPTTAQQISQNKMLFAKMQKNKTQNQECVMHMNTLVAFTNPQNKRQEQDEYCIVLMANKDKYGKKEVPCNQWLEMALVVQRIATSTQLVYPDQLLVLNTTETKSLVKYLLAPKTKLAEEFPFVLELDQSESDMMDDSKPIKVPMSLNVLLPAHYSLAQCLNDENEDVNVTYNFAMSTPPPNPALLPSKIAAPKMSTRKRSMMPVAADDELKKKLFPSQTSASESKKRKKNPVLLQIQEQNAKDAADGSNYDDYDDDVFQDDKDAKDSLDEFDE